MKRLIKPQFYLTWYGDTHSDLVGEEKIEVTEEQIKEWFWLREEDYFDGLIVRSSQRHFLQPIVKHEMDLNKHDYFVEYLIDNTKVKNEKKEIPKGA